MSVDNTDLSSRIEIVKMNILPRLLYLYQSLPISIPQSQFMEWDKWISRFIWGGKRPRIRLATLQLPKGRGGLAVQSFQDYYYAAQIRTVACWCNMEYVAKWKDIETNGENYQIQKLLGDKELFRTQENVLDPIIKLTLNTWNTVIKRYKIGKQTKILRWITNDNKFQPGKEDAGFKRSARGGITAICRMVEKGEMQSFQYLRDKFDLERGDHFRYLQVREYYIKEIQMDKNTKQNGVIKVMIEAYEGKKGRVISALLESRGNSTLYKRKVGERTRD